MRSEYEEVKVKLLATKKNIKVTSSKITDLAKRKLEALLGGQYTREEEKTIAPRLKELLLQKTLLVRTRMEQERRKSTITDSMAGLGAQLGDGDAKAPLEVERVGQVNPEKEQQLQEEKERATADFMTSIDAQPEDMEAKALSESHAPAKLNPAPLLLNSPRSAAGETLRPSPPSSPPHSCPPSATAAWAAPWPW